ncbi:MAG: lytic murein transglycosylase B [Immundisolibacteraceae bacterium]|nr:lytic murein transglycosylase B [Immundisolibacteraceae bacterium]
MGQKRILAFLCMLLLGGFWSIPAVHADEGGVDLPTSPRLLALVEQLVSEQGFDRAELTQLLSDAEYKQSIINAITRPAEGVLAWHQYRKIFVTSKRTKQGIRFWQDHATELTRAEQTYGVPAQVIAAIIGVETYYGRHTGGYRVVDALMTLAASDYRRHDFFRDELRAFLILNRDEQQDPRLPVGSYAGAIGIPQFMPTSYQEYAVDFDGDGRRDLVNNVTDAIGSVANYLARHGWQPDQPIINYVDYALQSGDPDQDPLIKQGYKPHSSVAQFQQQGVSWADGLNPDLEREVALLALGQKNGHTMVAAFKNFYVITRYNHSPLYAMAVFQLSESLRLGYQAK